MAKNNGHWYTDKNGNHYFVEDGQTPQEGWEASKRRKMISGGKYMTSENGNDYSEVDRDKYEAYEADEADFDENEEDDFGFDEEDDFTQTINEMKDDNVNLDDPREVMQYLGANMGLDREDQVKFMERLGYSVNDIEKLRNPSDDDEDINEEEYDRDNFEFTEAEERQIDKYAEHYGADANEMKKSIYAKAQEYMKGDNMGDEEAYDKAMEEVLDEVANGEYNREMQKAQEENARLSKGDEPLDTDALYRPDKDKGPRESKGPADPNAPAGKINYSQDDKEFLKYMGANLKNTQYGRQETLDEYYERVKDKHTDEMDDWKAFISTAYAMSPKEVDRYIKLKESQGREPENDDPIYSHFRKKFNVSDKDLDDLRGYDYDRSKYKDNNKLTWKDPVESWADPVKDFAKEHNISEEDVQEFLNRAYDRTNKSPLKDGTDVYGSQKQQWSNEDLDKAIEEHDLMGLTPEFRDAILKRISERLNGKK